MEGEARVQGNGVRRGGAESERVPGGMGGGVPALVTLGTGNVYCLWLPVCFQPLTSPFVSHQLGPTLFTQALHTAGGWAMDGDLVSQLPGPGGKGGGG